MLDEFSCVLVGIGLVGFVAAAVALLVVLTQGVIFLNFM
jgi:hypothetical protein